MSFFSGLGITPATAIKAFKPPRNRIKLWQASAANREIGTWSRMFTSLPRGSTACCESRRLRHRHRYGVPRHPKLGWCALYGLVARYRSRDRRATLPCNADRRGSRPECRRSGLSGEAVQNLGKRAIGRCRASGRPISLIGGARAPDARANAIAVHMCEGWGSWNGSGWYGGVLPAALVNGLLTPPTQVSTHHPTRAMANLFLISAGYARRSLTVP